MSFLVSWNNILIKFIYGIFCGFKVFYGKISEFFFQYKIFKIDQLKISLIYLEKYMEYCVKLVGFIKIGDGNKSSCFNVMIDEDGKYVYFLFIFVIIYQRSGGFGNKIKDEKIIFIL